MPWNYDDAQINGIIDGNLKDSPPHAPQVNTAGTVRALLKALWAAIRGQVSTAVNGVDAIKVALDAQLNPATNAATQAAASAAIANALVTGVSTARPSIRPSLLLDFSSEMLDPRITYTRSDSNKSYFDQKGVLRMAKANEWPREFDPITGRCLGRSVWESRTNNFAYSEQFDLWTVFNATITANTTIAPNGTLTADTLTENSANAAHYVSRGVNYVDTQPITVSCYMKAGTRTVGYISLYNGTATMNVYFNLTTGTVLSVNAALTASMVSVGNGWYRVACTYNSTVTATGGAVFGGSIIAAQTYQGDGVSTLHFWGAQLEVGAFASPYIPTTATPATRQADVASINGTNFSEWYGADEGTLFAAATVPVVAGTIRRIAVISDGTINNTIQLAVHSVSAPYIEVRDANSIQASNTIGGSGAVAVGDPVYVALGFKRDDFYAFANGGALTDNAGTVPSAVNQLLLGYQVGVGYYNAPIGCIAYWPKRLANTEIQALTTSGLLAGKNPNQLPTVGDLGSAAFVQLRALLAMRNRQEFQILGTGTSQSYTIRRPYAFQFRTVDVPSGSTVTATPSTTVASSEDTDYTLTITVAVGKLFTYSITPIVP